MLTPKDQEIVDQLMMKMKRYKAKLEAVINYDPTTEQARIALSAFSVLDEEM